jgi:hypothetical protein
VRRAQRRSRYTANGRRAGRGSAPAQACHARERRACRILSSTPTSYAEMRAASSSAAAPSDPSGKGKGVGEVGGRGRGRPPLEGAPAPAPLACDDRRLRNLVPSDAWAGLVGDRVAALSLPTAATAAADDDFRRAVGAVGADAPADASAPYKPVVAAASDLRREDELLRLCFSALPSLCASSCKSSAAVSLALASAIAAAL